ncbi:cytosine permease [Acidithiobacillus sp. IBUN Pt1247-S3]|uniref:purine-cytosine permease family protein n=1 Tax=Acidithiobacillus sp. IBUN Pt1247-S3 TaxID=3166642 RepID=UPI0034E4C150
MSDPLLVPRTAELGQIESLGVAPVPDASRNMGSGMLFLIWALASASATTPVIGLLLKNVGLFNFVWLVFLATAIGFVPGLLFAHMGRQVPIISMVMARRTFGMGGATVLALLYTVVGAGWFGLNTDVGGSILDSLFPGFGLTWYLLLGALQIGLVFFGMELLEKFYKYTAILFLLCYAVLAWYLFTRYPLRLPVVQGAVPWGKDIDLILSFSLLAWAYDFPTVTRFCVPWSPQEPWFRSLGFASMPSLGVMTAVLLMGILGLVALGMSGEWNIALLGKELPVWGEVSAVGVILAIAHTNAMNLYPAVTKFLAVINVAERRTPQWLQPAVVLGLGGFSTLLAILGILHFIENFLNLLGELLFPFTFILLVDWFLGRYHQNPASRFFAGNPDSPSLWSWSAGWAVVMLLAAIGMDQLEPWLPAALPLYLPWQVVSALLAAMMYGLGLHWAERRWTWRTV